MIADQIKALSQRIESLSQIVLHPPRSVRVKEFFPDLNAVTIQIIGKGATGAGALVKDSSGDRRFPLGYRGDVSVSMAPQPGDIGLLFYTGMQYKNGFVFLSHTPGGEDAVAYTPVRGAWGLTS